MQNSLHVFSKSLFFSEMAEQEGTMVEPLKKKPRHCVDKYKSLKKKKRKGFNGTPYHEGKRNSSIQSKEGESTSLTTTTTTTANRNDQNGEEL